MFSSLVFSVAILSKLASAGIVANYPTILHLAQNGGPSSHCLTAQSNADNAAVVLEPCTNSANQQWSFSSGAPGSGTSSPGTLKIFGNKCLDVPNGSATNGNKLQIFTCFSGNTNQQWIVNSAGPAISNIRWSGHNSCVDNTGGSLSNGNPAQIFDCVNNANQQWAPQALPGVLPTGTPTHFAHGTDCISATSLQNNGKVTIQPCNSNIHTNTWVHTSSGQLTIGGNFCLDVTNGANADGTKLQIFQCATGNTNQKWSLLSSTAIQWVGTNKCVDLTNGVTTPGNQLQIFTCVTGNTNQKWAQTPEFNQ